MRALRILMFTTFYPPYSFGGDAVGVQRMAQALVKRGHDVTVVHDKDAYQTMGGEIEGKSYSEDGVAEIALSSEWPVMTNLLTQQTGRPLVHGGKIKQLIQENAFDIIWHNNTSLVGGPGLLDFGDALKIYEAHEHWLVCPMHVLWKENKALCEERSCLKCTLSYKRPPQLWRYTGFLERKLEQIDLLIAKSEFSRQKHKQFGLKKEMTVLPYFLPDIDAASLPEPAQHDRPYFLFVGRLEKIKGLQDVFPAFDKYQDADLLILGDGEYSEELKALAAGNDRIKFLGRKNLDELNAYYRGALGLIVPSVCYETFGIILIESFRLGTPVIARRLGPFPEIVEGADAGALFETEEDLIQAMTTIQTDETWRARHGELAREGFESTWREDRVLAAYGVELAKAAHRRGDIELAQAFEAGAFENGPA
jgi:glycosyltransferase involved in cell wall biosynthesis